jgi:penicillin amidase
MTPSRAFQLQKPLGTVLILAVALTTGSCGSLSNRLDRLARTSLAQIQGEIRLAGLEQEVEILRDEWGIAHIYANTVEDLFFAQGFVAAQDRLWQLELWRRVGEGRLAEIAGPQAFERDRLARLLRYRGDMEAEWASYHPDARTIITAFTKGINAFIEHTVDNPPVEFKLTGVTAAPWSPEVPLLRMAGLPMTRNARNEIRLARSVAEIGVNAANQRDAPDPWHRLRVPRGLDVATIPTEVDEILSAGYAALPRIPVLDEYSDLTRRPDTAQSLAGSNNWAVSGAMTATGMPILANDPHRSIMLPSLRYLVHLNGPGWNVIGSGEPALPGVAIGHNERIAWGLTIVGIDQQDIFVEELNPAVPDQVRRGNSWEALEVEIDTIWVKGEGPRVVELKFSQNGPIVSLRLDQAQNWDEFLAAMDHWLVPSENMVYADVDGDIGWQAAGLTPIRCCGWVGRLPAPGTGNYEWRGFRPMSELPREYNPARGYITTANHNIMPSGYTPPLGYNWSSPIRFHRLDDVLSDSGGFTIADFERLQHDVHSPSAAEAVTSFQGWTGESEKVERARQMLANWSAELGRDSPEAALFKAWQAAFDTRAIGSGTAQDSRDSLVQAALTLAVDSLEQWQGTDWSEWRWGAMHRTLFRHPVTAAFDLPTVERGGDRTTVNVTGQSGASFREVVDLSNWDNSVVTSVPGQSGQPGSPHYGDLLELWAEGQYFPLAFSREAVEEHVAHRLVLKPRG